MIFAVLVVFSLGIATGAEISAQYPEVPAAINEFQQ